MSTYTSKGPIASTAGVCVRNDGEGIQFNIDPAMLQQLQNATGFVPVIISIQPMTDIKTFLGVQN